MTVPSGAPLTRGWKPSAYQGAVAMLKGLTTQQSMVLAFQDVYIMVGVMFALSLCLLVFLGKGAKGRMPADAH